MSGADVPLPSVGRIVHYVSRGSADGRFPSVCRAALVTSVAEPGSGWSPLLASLSVHNPTGLFFDQHVSYAPAGPDGELVPGTWHWPERVG